MNNKITLGLLAAALAAVGYLAWVDWDRPGTQADGNNSDTFRTRHNNNTACNFLFGDGHAETRTFSRNGLSRDQGKTALTHANFLVPIGHPTN